MTIGKRFLIGALVFICVAISIYFYLNIGKTDDNPTNTHQDGAGGYSAVDDAQPFVTSDTPPEASERTSSMDTYKPAAVLEEEPGLEEVTADEAYARNQMFEAEAMEAFPLHTINTHNPLEPQAYGPRPGEIWIRVKVEHGRELKDIMAQVADLYLAEVQGEGPVTVMHWVGGRPHARYRYPSDKE